MSEANGSAKRFRVDAAADVPEKIERLFREAQLTGQATAFATALKRIFGILETRPRVFGEPLRSYKQAQLEERAGAVRPVAVRYAVHQIANEVVFLNVELIAQS